MKIKPMIGQYEVAGIQRIGASEDRRLVEIPVPGLEGSLTQDLGSGSVAIHIQGTLSGDEARDDFLSKVREMFKAGEPVDFVADIATATTIEKVLISDLKVHEQAGSADTFRYWITLAQYVEPPAPAAADSAAVDAAVADEAGQQFNASQAPDLINSLPELKDPTTPLKGTLDSVHSAMGSLAGVQDSLTTLFGG